MPWWSLLDSPVVLPGSFSVGNVWQPESIVILWRHGLEVVHSFYLNRDQLKHQNPHYVKRTSLYQSEMQKGNASLRLENVTIEDRGEYICSVRSQLGSERKIFPLKVAGKCSQYINNTSQDALNFLLTLLKLTKLLGPSVGLKNGPSLSSVRLRSYPMAP